MSCNYKYIIKCHQPYVRALRRNHKSVDRVCEGQNKVGLVQIGRSTPFVWKMEITGKIMALIQNSYGFKYKRKHIYNMIVLICWSRCLVWERASNRSKWRIVAGVRTANYEIRCRMADSVVRVVDTDDADVHNRGFTLFNLQSNLKQKVYIKLINNICFNTLLKKL